MQSTSTLLSHQVNQRLCFDISIMSDGALENDELFQVILTSDDLSFNPGTATITIIDSSCKNFTFNFPIMLLLYI